MPVRRLLPKSYRRSCLQLIAQQARIGAQLLSPQHSVQQATRWLLSEQGRTEQMTVVVAKLILLLLVKVSLRGSGTGADVEMNVPRIPGPKVF